MRYDFKCNRCGLIEEANMSFEKSECGYPCPDCKGIMERQFTLCSNFICRWDTPNKKGLNAAKDRYDAFKGLEEQGKLPRSITPKMIGG